jgi:hypothetical protein
MACKQIQYALKKNRGDKRMVKRKTENEYFAILTTVRIDRGTDRKLKETTRKLDISQSVFIRQAIKDAIDVEEVQHKKHWQTKPLTRAALLALFSWVLRKLLDWS